MKLRGTWFITVFVLVSFLAGATAAQEDITGCCCNTETGIARWAGFTLESLCPADHHFEPSENIPGLTPGPGFDTACLDFCETYAPPPETQLQACGNPTNPTPVDDVVVTPVKGARQFLVSWTQNCTADSYIIDRCTGDPCDDTYVQVAEVSGRFSYLDEDNALEMDETYTYRVKASYAGLQNGISPPVEASAFTGHLECLGVRHSDTMCIALNYYNQYEAYLTTYGYKGITPHIDSAVFLGDFAATVTNVFSIKNNAPFFCNENNQLIPKRTAGGKTKCDLGTICIPEDPPQCLVRSNCEREGIFMGLGVTRDNCEGVDPNRNYCFFDASTSIFKTCYPCDPSLACYDYKSQETCERDPCNIGRCAWQAYKAGDFDSGVCKNLDTNNCNFCDARGSVGSPTSDVYSDVFDRCTEAKALALSTDQFECFYNADSGEAVGCAEATCNSFTTPETCQAPPGGVTLDARTNQVLDGSTDTCGFQVCQWDSNLEIPCQKNADGTDPSLNWPDCSSQYPDLLSDEYKACEQDLVPPVTNYISQATTGTRIDRITFEVFDKKNNTALLLPTSQYDNDDDYRVFVCLDGASCTYRRVSTREINVDNLELKEGAATLFALHPGPNTVRFFAQDPAMNKEISRTLMVTGCEDCDGPKVVEVVLSGGYVDDDDVIYYADARPTFDVALNKEAEVVFVEVRQNGETFGITVLETQGGTAPFALNYTFIADLDLPDGTYEFVLNTRDENGVAMAQPLVQTFVIDTVAPSLSVLSFNESDVVTRVPLSVVFNTSERVRIINVTLTHDILVGNVNVDTKTIDLTKSFLSPDDMLFTSNAINITDGEKTLRIWVMDLAGNVYERTITFFVDAAPPLIWVENPPMGMSATALFDFIIRTDGFAECRYWPDESPPPGISFSGLDTFDITEDVRRHIEQEFEIPYPEEIYPVYVSCEDEAGRVSDTVIELMHITQPPQVLSVFASPNPVVQLPLQTAISVELTQPSFCKYSLEDESYDAMSHTFPGFGLRPDFINIGVVSLPDEPNATVYVQCMNAIGLGPANGSTIVDLALHAPFSLSSATPDLLGVSKIPITVTSNRDAFCTVVVDGVRTLFASDSVPKKNHRTNVSVNLSKVHRFDVTCATPAGVSSEGVEEETIRVEVLVDLTPPNMMYVRDDSSNENNTEFSFLTDQLRASWNANETETDVTLYYYRVAMVDNTTVVDCSKHPLGEGCVYATKSDPDDFFYIQFDEDKNRLNLTEQEDYFVYVAAQNLVGLVSGFNSSDGVTIDLASIPLYCSNGLLDATETDIDCGGSCGPTCLANQSCVANTDCASQVCDPVTLRCSMASCFDGVQNGYETGLDCGGDCDPCEDGMLCLSDDDCETGFCSAQGMCTEEDDCANGVLNEGETDVDCGGVCPFQCAIGDRCVEDLDCEQGACIDNFCRDDCNPADEDCDGVTDDSDGDGVPDHEDTCPRTPAGEVVNDQGCSAAQRDTDQDGLPDSWEIRYGLDPDDANDALADTDNDGITNIDEYRYGTDPTKIDSDGDGWSDYDEIMRGFDPNDPSSHPQKKGFLIFILLILLLALGVGGYYGYQYYKSHGRGHALRAASGLQIPGMIKKAFGMSAPKIPAKTQSKPAPEQSTTQAVSEHPPEPQWVSLEDVTAKKKEKKDDVFSKLKSIKNKPVESKTHNESKEGHKVDAQEEDHKLPESIFKTLGSYTKDVKPEPANTTKSAIEKLKKKNASGKNTEVSAKLKSLAKKGKKK